MSFAKSYKEQRIQSKQKDDCKSYVSLIELMLIRSVNYVFGNCRKYVFEEFMEKDNFILESVLRNIATCTNVKIL